MKSVMFNGIILFSIVLVISNFSKDTIQRENGFIILNWLLNVNNKSGCCFKLSLTNHSVHIYFSFRRATNKKACFYEVILRFYLFY
jgi:hypothetical protein